MPTSRSAIATRRACAVKRYWQYDYLGKGLERRTASLPLVGGTRLHAALARILLGANVDQVIVEEQAAYGEELQARGVNGTDTCHLDFLIHEQQTLLEGLIRGWVRFRLPLILEEYSPVAVEQEWLVNMGDGFELPLRIDSLERHKGTGLLHIRDFKTLPYLRDGWREHYLHELQTLLYIEAVERHTGEYCDGIEYEALMKGARRSFKTGLWVDRDLQMSPLCYGYAIEGKDATVYQSEYTARKGARKFAVWEEFVDVEDWLTHVEEPVWRGLYATTGLISPTQQERFAAVYQVKQGEALYREQLTQLGYDLENGYADDIRRAVSKNLEPNTDHCYAYGSKHRCAFYELCHGGLTEEPLECGLYDLRIDHHLVESEPEQEAA
jgi:hypothetical protein